MVPTRANMIVMVVLPLAMLLCAKPVRSQSIQPVGEVRVNVERVISVVEQAGALDQTVVLSLNPLQAYTAMVEEEVPPRLVWYRRRIISVGVMADGHGIEDKSNSMSTRLSPLPPLEVPSVMVVWEPTFTVDPERISTSGTEGTTPVCVNTLPREMLSV